MVSNKEILELIKKIKEGKATLEDLEKKVEKEEEEKERKKIKLSEEEKLKIEKEKIKREKERLEKEYREKLKKLEEKEKEIEEKLKRKGRGGAPIGIPPKIKENYANLKVSFDKLRFTIPNWDKLSNLEKQKFLMDYYDVEYYPQRLNTVNVIRKHLNIFEIEEW